MGLLHGSREPKHTGPVGFANCLHVSPSSVISHRRLDLFLGCYTRPSSGLCPCCSCQLKMFCSALCLVFRPVPQERFSPASSLRFGHHPLLHYQIRMQGRAQHRLLQPVNQSPCAPSVLAFHEDTYQGWLYLSFNPWIPGFFQKPSYVFVT